MNHIDTVTFQQEWILVYEQDPEGVRFVAGKRCDLPLFLDAINCPPDVRRYATCSSGTLYVDCASTLADLHDVAVENGAQALADNIFQATIPVKEERERTLFGEENNTDEEVQDES